MRCAQNVQQLSSNQSKKKLKQTKNQLWNKRRDKSNTMRTKQLLFLPSAENLHFCEIHGSVLAQWIVIQIQWRFPINWPFHLFIQKFYYQLNSLTSTEQWNSLENMFDLRFAVHFPGLSRNKSNSFVPFSEGILMNIDVFCSYPAVTSLAWYIQLLPHHVSFVQIGY